jgi:hypothetical protein
MSKEATLFEEAHGSPLEGYFLLRARGGNIPPNWIKHARQSRKQREEATATALKQGDWWEITTLRDWELSYRKECFYRGIRVLMELEREGSSSR